MSSSSRVWFRAFVIPSSYWIRGAEPAGGQAGEGPFPGVDLPEPPAGATRHEFRAGGAGGAIRAPAAIGDDQPEEGRPHPCGHAPSDRPSAAEGLDQEEGRQGRRKTPGEGLGAPLPAQGQQAGKDAQACQGQDPRVRQDGQGEPPGQAGEAAEGRGGAAPAEAEPSPQADHFAFVFQAERVVGPTVEGVGPEGQPVQAPREPPVDPRADRGHRVHAAQAVRMARRRTAVP